MYNTNIPSDRELPSTSKLIKSTVIALVVAGVLLVAVVMPSEYGIDPTGLGEISGLKRMGEIKVSLAKEAETAVEKSAKTTRFEVTIADAEPTTAVAEVEEPVVEALPPAPAVIPNNKAYQHHEITFSLAPDEGTEVKVTMAKGAKVDYIWETNGGKSNFDVHGDSKKLKISYHPYYKGSDSKREGTLEAAFDGGHGWFWRNRTNNTLTITIKTTGEYTGIKRY
ncbi:MAG: hypothetical protein ACJAUP_000374 [Cellvibrionaceae bacterium]|jgi:hypothetical protein